MDASSTGTGAGKRHGGAAAAPVYSLGTDLICAILSLLDHIHLIRCSVVCKSWNAIVFQSTLMRDLYQARNPNVPIPSQTSMRRLLEGLAMEDHRLGFLAGSAHIRQWNAHSVRINLCRMKRGLLLTGAEDKVLRLWSAESYKCLAEYPMNTKPLIDCDFDENKIVGLATTQMCILRRNGKRSIFQFRDANSTRGLCMSYIDPEAVIGCDDGRARVLDMYSGSCSRIIRMHGGPVTCMALSEEQLIFGGSSFGSISIADLSTGELVASLKTAFSPTGMKSLSFSMRSSLLFAGSTAGYAHCWDLRTLRPLWETKVSPNVVYSVHHMPSDTSTLAAGGLDGVLRILSQNTGEVLSSFVMDTSSSSSSSSVSSITGSNAIEKKRARTLQQGVRIDIIPRSARPPITCLRVGLNKIVTTHNEKHLSMWKFHP